MRGLRANTRGERSNDGRRSTFLAPVSRRATCSKNWASRNSIRNQGQCGNCWSFSTAETIRSAYTQQHGEDPGELSTQYLTDCMYRPRNGCKGGMPIDALNWIAENGGIPTKAAYDDQLGSCSSSPPPPTPPTPTPTPTPTWNPSYPWYPGPEISIFSSGPVSSSGEGTTCSGNYPSTDFACKSGISAAVTVSGGQKQQSEEDMASYVCSTGSLSIAVDASSFHDYTGGILSYSCGNQLDHAVLLVGINAEKNSWIVQNSWVAMSSRVDGPA